MIKRHILSVSITNETLNLVLVSEHSKTFTGLLRTLHVMKQVCS